MQILHLLYIHIVEQIYVCIIAYVKKEANSFLYVNSSHHQVLGAYRTHRTDLMAFWLHFGIFSAHQLFILV